jgi:soluble lytic murein transglycosylase-like protein
MGDARADVSRITPPPAPSAVKGPGTEQWPSFDVPKPPADIDARSGAATAQNADPQPAGQEAMGDAWPQPREDGQTYAQAGVAGLQDLSGAERAQQPTGAPPPLFVGPAADPNFVLANAGGDDVQEAQQQKPLPQNQQTQQKRPPGPSGAGQGKTPPAPRIPEKLGMEMTELERRREQEFAQFNQKYRRLKEAERRQPIWDAITRFPPPDITPENKLQDLLPDNWQEKIDPRYVAWTRAAAERNNIPLELLARLLYKESNYNKDKVSPSGARGIAQLTLGAVKSVGLNPDKFNYSDPEASINAGAAYLAQHYRRFKNWPKATAAYNAGPNYLDGWLGGVSPDWSTMPKEDKRARPWNEMKTYLQYIFRGQPDYFDK